MKKQKSNDYPHGENIFYYVFEYRYYPENSEYEDTLITQYTSFSGSDLHLCKTFANRYFSERLSSIYTLDPVEWSLVSPNNFHLRFGNFKTLGILLVIADQQNDELYTHILKGEGDDITKESEKFEFKILTRYYN